jgi:hypothetical protein
MKVTIDKISNGYIIKYWDEVNEMEILQVVEEQDTGEETLDELKALRELFYKLSEAFNVWGSKHSYKMYYDIINEQTGEEVE